MAVPNRPESGAAGEGNSSPVRVPQARDQDPVAEHERSSALADTRMGVMVGDYFVGVGGLLHRDRIASHAPAT